MAGSSLVYVGIAPHPPIMVPEVGGSATEEVRASIAAMHEFTKRVISSGAETVVLISPHAPLAARAFVAYHGHQLKGSFAGFRAPDTNIEATLDEEMLSAITKASMVAGYQVIPINGQDLDHGTTVPLYFLQRNGWRGEVVLFGYTFLSNVDHLKFGNCIRTAADTSGKPIALVASGDLSHRLKITAPAGFNEDAYLFDEEVVEAINESTPERIVNIDPQLRSLAGECGYRSMLIAIGASDGLDQDCEVLSYEAPFGVGYLVAQLVRGEREQNQPKTSGTTLDSHVTEKPDLAALARLAVETFVRDGYRIKPTSSSLNFRAACFVSIKTLSGELRGCVGTIEPVSQSFEEELIANAINAATRDPRFPSVKPAELAALRYSVDVLSELEPASIDDLDPMVYGVVVNEKGGARRGVLLPDIHGVDSVAQQVAIATRKAGIMPDSPVTYFRFCVTRYRESTD